MIYDVHAAFWRLAFDRPISNSAENRCAHYFTRRRHSRFVPVRTAQAGISSAMSGGTATTAAVSQNPAKTNKQSNFCNRWQSAAYLSSVIHAATLVTGFLFTRYNNYPWTWKLQAGTCHLLWSTVRKVLECARQTNVQSSVYRPITSPEVISMYQYWHVCN